MSSSSNGLISLRSVLLAALYVAVALSYWWFMAIFSPHGIEWQPWRFELIRNAVVNILKGFDLVKYGVTSWDSFDVLASSIERGGITAYLIPVFNYIHYIPFSIIFGVQSLNEIGPLLDRFIISLTAFLASRVYGEIVWSSNCYHKEIPKFVVYFLFLVSPWAYKISLFGYSEILFCLFLYLGYLLIRYGKIKTGLLSLAIGALQQYHWSGIFLIVYSSIMLTYICASRAEHGDNCLYLLNPLTSCKVIFRKQLLAGLLLAAYALPVAIALIQKVFVATRSYAVAQTNTSLLFRIGIDDVSNIHYGGIISALQFLVGNRLTICIAPGIGNHSFKLSSYVFGIYSFNCFLLHLGMLIISVVALCSFIRLASSRRGSPYSFYLLPVFGALVLFVFVFQQLFATHLTGYSYMFSMIYSVGIAYFLGETSQFIPARSNLRPLFILVSILAITFQSIRVSYLTGAMG